MPEITVTLVDHTQNTPDQLKGLIQSEIADMFADLLFSSSEVSVVNTRWTMPGQLSGGDQDLVLHFVESVSDSYINKTMPGKPIAPNDGGFTRSRRDRSGSEFYKSPIMGGKPTRLPAKAYAKLALHEALHNMTGMTNAELHGRGGLANSPPQLPVTEANRQLAQSVLGEIPNQLL